MLLEHSQKYALVFVCLTLIYLDIVMHTR